ncbi:hypothetical protein CHS0354_041081 [Potamilus streckersoni]|uniref:Uncharacterized protein n=1 Tax=Potamilus streckersoni TaxID=2493646 RepID=A0AAE0VU01_9BIVA|nr:hypothetical protein CHS0354_041081 [Potamilus streckersoni]
MDDGCQICDSANKYQLVSLEMTKADAAAKQSLQDTEVSILDPSTQELYSVVTKAINQQWQLQWFNSEKGRKLNQLQLKVQRGNPLHPNFSIRDQRIFNRLRKVRLSSGQAMNQMPTPTATHATFQTASNTHSITDTNITSQGTHSEIFRKG